MRFLTTSMLSLGALTMLLGAAPSAQAESNSRCGYGASCYSPSYCGAPCYGPSCYAPPCYYTPSCYTPPCYSSCYTPSCYTPCYSCDCYSDCYSSCYSDYSYDSYGYDRGARNHKKVAPHQHR